MNDDVKAALMKFAVYCRKFHGDDARVYDHNAADIETALAYIAELETRVRELEELIVERDEGDAYEAKQAALLRSDTNAWVHACIGSDVRASLWGPQLERLSHGVDVLKMHEGTLRAVLGALIEAYSVSAVGVTGVELRYPAHEEVGRIWRQALDALTDNVKSPT